MMMAPSELERVEREQGIVIRRILRGDVPTFMEVPPASTRRHLKGAEVAILGIPWEGYKYESPGVLLPPLAHQAPPTSSYFRTGADRAPEAIRRYSRFYSILQGGGFFPEMGWDLRLKDALTVVDYGDVEIVPGDAESSFRNAEEKVSHILGAGAVPVVFGGDHGITYPVLKAVAQHTGGKIGIIDFDSHIDLEPSLKYHAAWQFLGAFQQKNISPKNMVQIGIRNLDNHPQWAVTARKLGITSFTITDVEERGITTIVEQAIEIATKGTAALYVTLDVDVIDPAFCPAQKYPDPAGLTAREIVRALRMIGTRRLAGFDICCLSPQYDSPTGTGAQLAARCAAVVIGSIALNKKRRRASSRKR